MSGAFRTCANVFVIQRHHQLGCIHPAVWIPRKDRSPAGVDQLQVLRFPAVRQIAGKPGAAEPLREDMLQEQSDKIHTSDSERFLPAVIGIVLVTEGNVRIRDRDNAAVGNSRTEGIAGKVTNRVAPAVEGLADERDPCFPKKSVNKRFPTERILKLFDM